MYKISLTLLLALCCATTFAQTFDVTASEINYNPEPTRNSSNWIELHNYGTQSISLASYKLRKPSTGEVYVLPNTATTTLAAGGYLVLVENTGEFASQFPSITNRVGPTEISLGNGGDTLTLENPSGTVLLTIGFSDGAGWPKCADGFGRSLESASPNAPSNLLNPANWFDGCMFGSPGSAYTPCTPTIVFNEINYKSPATPDAGDWVELYNVSGQPLNVSGWQFRDDKDTLTYTIPANTIIPNNDYLVIYGNLDKFNTVHPNITNKVGPFGFSLGKDGEIIRLYDNFPRIVLSMFYNDAAPWPQQADGEGPTLELIDPAFDLNKGTSWEASCFYGTPGHPNTDCGSGVASILEGVPFEVYPNPNPGAFTVETADWSPTQWVVYDLAGRAIGQGRVDPATTVWSIQLPTVPDGLYTLEVLGNEGVVYRKIVVRR